MTRKAPYGVKKDGTPRAKPGRKKVHIVNRLTPNQIKEALTPPTSNEVASYYKAVALNSLTPEQIEAFAPRLALYIAERKSTPKLNDSVEHPKHYTSHPSGVECIQITEHMNFNLGNAVKYIWRAGEKGATIEDLKKAAWYVNREIGRLSK